MTIQIVSRYVPIANRAGHFTYLLKLVEYLHAAGFSIELDVLDPWFISENIPEEIHAMAQVVLMPATYIERESEARASRTGRTRRSFRQTLAHALPPS